MSAGRGATQRRQALPRLNKKKRRRRSAAKFREETSKKQESKLILSF
jgi:hypothetical protein